MEQYAADPKVLSLEEILYAAILTDNVAEQKEIYSTAIKLYPQDFRGYNNLGVLAYNAGDYATAKEYFAEAAKVDKNAPEVNLNLGYLELLEGNVAAAEAYMAIGAGAKAGDEALGNLYIAQGLYGRAAYLLEKEPSNSTALAQLLDADYSTAKKTIASIKNPDATTHYIKAVLGARTGNAALIYDGLKSAVKLDPSFAKKALGDLEFAKYANDEAFKSILK
jgi:tetratricopeptide (TPR) repeat protein